MSNRFKAFGLSSEQLKQQQLKQQQEQYLEYRQYFDDRISFLQNEICKLNNLLKNKQITPKEYKAFKTQILNEYKLLQFEHTFNVKRSKNPKDFFQIQGKYDQKIKKLKDPRMLFRRRTIEYSPNLEPETKYQYYNEFLKKNLNQPQFDLLYKYKQNKQKSKL